MIRSTEDELQKAYRGDEFAGRYVRERFASELYRLLHDRQVAAVQRLMEAVRPTRTLEIAPGPGRLTRDIRPIGSLVCLEYNAGMTAHGLRACGTKATWVRGNGFQLPFGQCFDLVYSFRFIRHFHREDRARLYAEIRRVLNPGGYLVLDAINDRISRPLRRACPEDYRIYDKLYHRDELCTELKGAGLEPVRLEPVQKWVQWQYRSQVLLGPRANWLNRLVIRALERLPRREGLEWVVTCRRA